MLVFIFVLLFERDLWNKWSIVLVLECLLLFTLQQPYKTKT